jgi:hypothetical protein
VQVIFLVCHVWHGVSATACSHGDSSADKGQHRRTAGLRLSRFDPRRPCEPSNLVLLKEEEAEELRSVGWEVWWAARPEAARFVRETLRRVREYFGCNDSVIDKRVTR